MAIYQETEIKTIIDQDGNETTSKIEKTKAYHKNEEPDYIKLYTRMWCEFNDIPMGARKLFLELVTRMTYCNMDDLENSQLVNTGKPWSTSIMKALGWKEDMYKQQLRALKNCGAIRSVGRGVYQINPNYAGRGEWKYNPKLKRGGIENLVATFNFKDKTVDTKIIYAADRNDPNATDVDHSFLNGVDPEHNFDQAILSSEKITESEENHEDSNQED